MKRVSFIIVKNLNKYGQWYKEVSAYDNTKKILNEMKLELPKVQI